MDHTHLISYYNTHRKSTMKAKHPEFFYWLIEQTPFLPDDVTSTQRLWHVTNQSGIPLCLQCGAAVSWDTVKQQYRAYCSRTCAVHLLDTAREKRSASSSKVPCVVCGSLTRNNKSVAERTCSKKCYDTLKQQRKLNTIPLHEVILLTTPWLSLPHEEYMKQVISHKALVESIKTHTAHMGSDTYVKDRVAWLHGKRSSRELYRDELTLAKNKYPTVCEKEALVRFRTPNQTCTRCNINTRPYNATSNRLKRFCQTCTDDIAALKLVPRLKLALGLKKDTPPPNKNLDHRLNSRDWLYDMHVVQKYTKAHIARLLNVDKETITNRFKQYNITSVQYKNIPGEQNEVIQFLSSLGITNIQTNVKDIVAPKEIDIYLPDYKLAIEYCGLYWHSTSQQRITPTYHKNKMIGCNQKGIRLLTIYADEWINSTDVVKSKIKHILQKSDAEYISARTCTIRAVTQDSKKQFFDANHIQRNGPSSLNYGLYYNDRLVACIGFIKQANNHFIISRFATSANVRGGFGKLLQHFKRNHTWKKITTFADLRWSDGLLYQTSNFTLEGTIPPDYEYTKGTTRLHKFNFRHCHLHRQLGENYDPTKTETENMTAAGWYKIYDCGKQRWVLNNN